MLTKSTPSTVTSITEQPNVVIPNDCAWCLDELGIKPMTGSHSICERHEADMFTQLERIHEQRAARKALKS